MNPLILPRLRVEEPTVGILMSVNDGPFAGTRRKASDQPKIKERLDKELRHNVAIRVEVHRLHRHVKVLGRVNCNWPFLRANAREGYEVCVSENPSGF